MSNDTTNKKRTPTKQINEPPPQGWGLNKGRGLFITGTDTGVGKTLISGAIAKILSQDGKKAGVFKPVATGCRKTEAGLVSEDAEFLKRCTDTELSLDIINPVKFAKPAAPFSCEKAENRKVDFVKMAVAYSQICSKADYIIVEGIGGIRVPVTDKIDVLAMAKAFNLPIVIVARPGLGTINHTLLTIDAVRSSGLPLAGVVISGYDMAKADFAEQSAPACIAKVGKTQILAVVPYDNQTNIEKGIIGNIVMDSLNKVDWSKIIEDLNI
ncbi:MAG: dethiobiotin synthase [Phycisphaerae bacterium]|jgi:dethiobiotin synthetase